MVFPSVDSWAYPGRFPEWSFKYQLSSRAGKSSGRSCLQSPKVSAQSRQDVGVALQLRGLYLPVPEGSGPQEAGLGGEYLY